jgi:hypothetical protein
MVFRIARRLTAWGVVLTVAGSLVLPAVSARHLTPDADDMLVLGVARAGEIDLIGPIQQPPLEDHCAVCHWLCAFSGASVRSTVSPAAWLASGPAPAAQISARQGRSAVPAGPSRAPPLFTL